MIADMGTCRLSAKWEAVVRTQSYQELSRGNAMWKVLLRRGKEITTGQCPWTVQLGALYFEQVRKQEIKEG